MDEKIKLDLDPQKVLQSLREMASHSEELAKEIEDSLGKDAAKSVKKFEEAAEKGSARIGGFFRNLGTRVKEDLKAAFDFSRVMAGVKFTDEIAKGARQVLDLERAFDRLNVRLGASRSRFSELKTEIGKNSSAAGASLEKVLPGVEAVVARGNLKDVGALSEVSKLLAETQAATGEDTGSLAENIVESIQARGQKVDASTMKEAMDAAMAARNAGTFGSTAEAAAAIANLTPFAKQMGLGTRQTAALAAQSSGAGAPGVDVLRQLLERGSQVGGKDLLNKVLHADIFKGGKLDSAALKNIDLKQFKGLSQQQMAGIAGFSGTSGDDFVRFVNAFKEGDERFKAVVSGSEETAQAFEVSQRNLGSRLDRFRERLVNAGREIVGGVTESAEGALSGNMGRVKGGLSKSGRGLADNAGTIAGGTAATVAMGLLFGGGIKGLLKTGAGTGMGVAKGAALKGVGVQSVYVVNASEIGGGAAGGGAFEALGKFSKLGGIGSSITALLTSPALLAAAGVGAVGYAGLHSAPSHGTDQELAERDRLMREQAARGGSGGSVDLDHVADAVRRGAQSAKIMVETKGPYTNPSSVAPRGGGR